MSSIYYLRKVFQKPRFRTIVFPNGPSKICGRQSLKFTWPILFIISYPLISANTRQYQKIRNICFLGAYNVLVLGAYNVLSLRQLHFNIWKSCWNGSITLMRTFWYKQHLHKQYQTKMGKKLSQCTLRLIFSRIIGHILKSKQKNKYVCIHEIIWLIIMKMKMKMKKMIA